jgi:hypothetical protein
MSQMSHKGKRGDNKESKGSEKGKSVSRLHFFNIKNPFQGSQNKSTCYKTSKIGINHNQNTPMELNLVGINEACNFFLGNSESLK